MARLNHLYCRICHSPKGYTDAELALALLEDFHEQTKDKNDKRRLILLDGHISHCSDEFISRCKELEIEGVTYPPHTTHFLQGLDAVPFARLKELWSKERNRLAKLKVKVTKSNFLEHFSPVFEKCFTEDMVKAAFRRTGVIPFDPNAIHPERAFGPSKETSTALDMPPGLATPFRSILNVATSMIAPKARDPVDTYFNEISSVGGSPGSPTGSDSAPSSDLLPAPDYPPPLPQVSTPPNPFIAPAQTQQSPTVSHTILRSALDRSSLNFLVDTAEPFSSETPIPAPQFTAPLRVPSSPVRVREMPTVEELMDDNNQLRAALKQSEAEKAGLQSQLVVGTMYSQRLKKQLHGNETKRKGGRQHLLKLACARHVTGRRYARAVLADDQQRMRKRRIAERAQALKVAEAARKEELAAWKKERTANKEAMKMAVDDEYREAREQWEAAGKPRGQAPKKRKAPPLPATPERLKRPRTFEDLVGFEDLNGTSENEEEDGEDSDQDDD